ncbi:MAG: putative phage abortive infection protein [Pseudomonadota bacterium]
MDKDNNKLELIIGFILVIAAVAGVGAILVYITVFGAELGAITNDLSRWGQTGDFFGGILNPVFGFLSVLALVLTLRQNQKALQQNQEALEDSRIELSRSADALAKQVDHLERQAFQVTYFELLKLLSEVVDSNVYVKKTRGRSAFSSPPVSDEYNGRRLFGKLYRDLVYLISDGEKTRNTISRPKLLRDLYITFHEENEAYLGHYFRLLYNIVDFVDGSDALDKKFYVNILRAQLSSSELLLLFYNVMSNMGREKMLPLVVKYDILKHLPLNELIEEGDKEVFDDIAFELGKPE